MKKVHKNQKENVAKTTIVHLAKLLYTTRTTQ